MKKKGKQFLKKHIKDNCQGKRLGQWWGRGAGFISEVLAKNGEESHNFHTSLQTGEKVKEMPEAGIFYKTGKYCKKKRKSQPS